MEIGEGAVPPPPPGEKEKKLTVRWSRSKCRCGDEVKLVAVAKNIDDGKAKLELKQEGSTVDSKEADLAAGAAEAAWISKAHSDKRPEPPFELSGTAGGVSANAEKSLTLEKIPDVAQSTSEIACSSGVYGWTGKFDVTLKDGELLISTKIKLLNRNGPKPANPRDRLPDVDGTVSDADKAAMKADIEAKLTNKHFFHRKRCQRNDECDCPRERGCCKVRVRVEVSFVEAGEHHLVNLFQGNNRASATNWSRVKTRDNSYAHETGHLLGWYDEYAGGAVGTGPRWKVQEGVVMNTGLEVPAEYYWDFRGSVQRGTGEEWSIIKV